MFNHIADSCIMFCPPVRALPYVLLAMVESFAPADVKASYSTAVFTGYNEYCSLLRSGRESSATALYKGVKKGIEIWPEYTASRPQAYRADVVRMINERGC